MVLADKFPALPSAAPLCRGADQVFQFPDGARISRFLPHQPIEHRVVLFGRTCFPADAPFLERMIAYLQDNAIALDIFEAPLERAFEPILRLRRARLLQIVLKAYRIARDPRLWAYVPARLRRKDAYEQFRSHSFLTALQTLTPKPAIAIGRSAGAVAITRNAEALGLTAIICIGYPFRNPARGEEPERYRHLATLSTRCLILQGARDPYGDRVSARQYALSPAVTLSFVDGDHDTSYSEDALRSLLDCVVAFIRADRGRETDG